MTSMTVSPQHRELRILRHCLGKKVCVSHFLRLKISKRIKTL